MRDSITAHVPVSGDSLAVAADSVSAARDSIAAVRDSIAAARDSDETYVMLLRQKTDSVSPLRPDSLPSMALTAEGKAGDPVPYSLKRDNAVTVTLLVCFVIFLFSLHRSWPVVAKQVKDFFRYSHDDHDFLFNMSPFHLIMVFIDALLLSIGSYRVADEMIPGRFGSDSPQIVIAVFMGAFMAYFLLKWVAYSIVNGVFFGSKKTLQWNQALLLLVAMEGVLLFPLILLIVYFDVSVEKSLYLFIFILFLNKILTFFKSWHIFFKQNGRFLQNILYFCALEMTPLLAFGGAWLIMVKLLKVNF